jgi:hypothetical protein
MLLLSFNQKILPILADIRNSSVVNTEALLQILKQQNTPLTVKSYFFVDFIPWFFFQFANLDQYVSFKNTEAKSVDEVLNSATFYDQVNRLLYSVKLCKSCRAHSRDY